MTNKAKRTLDERYRVALDAPNPVRVTLLEVAVAGRVSTYTARAWVTGKQRPTAASMALLAEYYKMREDELFSPNHFDNATEEEQQ